MTRFEAIARVTQIWRGRRIQRLEFRADGGVDVFLAVVPPTIGRIQPPRDWSYHRLDANGHVDCHDSCVALELMQS